jgi:glycosyltransferase involved in cell wall biosynthesis
MEDAGPAGAAVTARVDVLIPAFNAASTIVEAVRSILQQTVRDIRVIVVNDGSTDATGALLAALAQEDPRLLVASQPNGGIVEALNNGLALCTAPIIARHDGDDIAYPDRFEKQLAYLDAHPDCIAVGANVRMIDGTGAHIDVSDFNRHPAGDAAWFPAKEPYLMHPLLMIRRDVLVGAGGYRYVFHAEDADLYWRVLAEGRLYNLPDVLADYRVHTDSVSGASVLNGRIQALSSQLSALSALRREAGREDLPFPKEQIQAFKQAATVEAMLAIVDPELDEAERRHLRLATAAKMIELAFYRPYYLEPSDWRFVKTAYRQNRNLFTAENAKDQHDRMVYYVAKMLARRKVANAMGTAPVTQVVAAVHHIAKDKLMRFAGRTKGKRKAARPEQAA